VLGKFSSYQVQASVAMIAMGAVVAAQHDLDFDLPSYVWALGSCCMNALYLTLVKRECNRHVHGDVVSEISLVNNLVPIPLLLVYLELSGERARAFDFEAWLNPVFWCVLLASTAAGCLLGFAQCLCTKHSSALTTTVVGQV
jgi:solute carrier family 35 protein